jgi:hypothetical protein
MELDALLESCSLEGILGNAALVGPLQTTAIFLTHFSAEKPTLLTFLSSNFAHYLTLFF